MEVVAVSAINLGVKSAAIAITDEIGLLLGVPEELFFIKKEYEMMQAFLLRAASTEDVKDPVVTTRIQHVQELASDVEKCLQEASVLLMKKEVKKGTNGGVTVSGLAAAAAGGLTMSELVLVPGSGISGLV